MEYKNPNIESSYQEHDLGKTLYDLVLKHKPKIVIDFGVLYGYSTIAMAMALDTLYQESGGVHKGKVIVCDLFEKYEHKHGTKQQLLDNIAQYGLSDYVEIAEEDFYDWIQYPHEFDMLHVDISNKGDTIETLYKGVKSQLEKGAVVVFEGGTEERDNVEWMVKYNQKKIVGCTAPYKVLNPNFPSISQLLAE